MGDGSFAMLRSKPQRITSPPLIMRVNGTGGSRRGRGSSTKHGDAGISADSTSVTSKRKLRGELPNGGRLPLAAIAREKSEHKQPREWLALSLTSDQGKWDVRTLILVSCLALSC